MNRIKLIGLLILSVGLLVSTAVQSKSDFECTFPVSEGSQPVRLFTLSAESYACFKQTNHRDLTLVNGLNQKVPFWLIHPVTRTNQTNFQKALSIYQEPVPSSYKTKDQIRRFTMLTGINPQSDSYQDWRNSNTYFSSIILKNDGDNDKLTSIDVMLKDSRDYPVKATVILEFSDDLQNWTVSSNPQTLYFLRGENDNINKNKLNTGFHGDMKFIRLATLSNKVDFAELINGVSGNYSRKSKTSPKIQWVRPSDIRPLENSQAWQYSIPDLVPVSQIRLAPASNIVFYSGSILMQPHTNPVLNVSQNSIRDNQKKKLKKVIKQALKGESRSDNSTSPRWYSVSRFKQFHLQTASGTSTVAPLPFTPKQGRVWQLNFDQPTEIYPDQLPQVEMGWTPSQISFIAQGPEPFQLLVGSDEPAMRNNSNSLLPTSDTDAELVVLMPEIDKGLSNTSTPVVSEPQKSVNWLKILLWAVLLAGVLLMAFMAFQLSKKMREEPE